jgi:signal transduction histidine kinase
LRLRVLAPLTAALAALLLAFVALLVRETRNRRAEDVARTAALVDDFLHAQLAEGVQVMRSVMELLMRDERLQAALRARDRETLLTLSEPILKELRARNRITHFYYILPDRTMLLRVQLPQEWGDRIDRFVLREAERTGKPFWGNEQGPFGSLTLRVTYPWTRDGALLGYFEMGIEFEDVMRAFHQILDVDVFVAIEKRFLDRAKWDRMQKRLGRHVDWNEFPSLVVLSRTRDSIPGPIASYLRSPRQGYEKRAFEVAWEDHVAQTVVLPFVDLRGRELGEIVVLRDVTVAAAEARQAILLVALVCLMVGGALFAFFYSLLGRVEVDVARRTADLKTSHERLAEEIQVRRRAERVLEQHSLELARSSAELEQVVSVASHDLQEPLRTVGSFLQVIERRYRDQLDSEGREFIRHAVEGARRMKAVIVDLVAYSGLGVRAGPPRPTDGEAVLAEALGRLTSIIEESGASVSHDPLPTFAGNASEVTQVFVNLIANAIKFRGEAAPRIHIRAEMTDASGRPEGHPAEPWWRFSVEDNGIGIASEHFQRIFVLFQRLHDRETFPGMGTGLAICKKVVERHGGRIWVESTPGAGSTFFFTLPGTSPPTS